MMTLWRITGAASGDDLKGPLTVFAVSDGIDKPPDPARALKVEHPGRRWYAVDAVESLAEFRLSDVVGRAWPEYLATRITPW